MLDRRIIALGSLRRPLCGSGFSFNRRHGEYGSLCRTNSCGIFSTSRICGVSATPRVRRELFDARSYQWLELHRIAATTRQTREWVQFVGVAAARRDLNLEARGSMYPVLLVLSYHHHHHHHHTSALFVPPEANPSRNVWFRAPLFLPG